MTRRDFLLGAVGVVRSNDGADTPYNLTLRVTSLESQLMFWRAVITEQGRVLTWLSKQHLNPWEIERRDRLT